MAGETIKADHVFKVGQRVQFYVGNDDERYPSRIEDMTEDHLICALPVNEQRVPVIPVRGEKVYGLAVGDQCRYQFFATFLGVTKHEDRIAVWHITKPATCERHQNREFVRVSVDLKVDGRFVEEDGTIGESFTTRTIDLSGNGVGLVLRKSVKEGTLVALTIYDIPDIGTIETMGVVARCSAVNLDEKHVIYHAGVLMKDLPRRTVNQIMRYLFTVQRKTIAKGIR